MPDPTPITLRMDCAGIDLTHPVDAIPENFYPYLFNARVVVEGRLESRPGYFAVTSSIAPALLHSIRRLNDETGQFALSGYIYVVGNGTKLDAGIITAINEIDSGYSGHPLSLIPFRPENSPVSFMYVYDENKLRKVRPDGVIRNIGVAPPSKPPVVRYGVPAMRVLTDADQAFGWTGYGAAGAASSVDRANSSSPTVTAVIYDSGSTGWCALAPNLNNQSFWTGDRMRVKIGTELVAVREINPAVDATTIQAIAYDTGSTGPCTVVLNNSPANVKVNTLLQFATEYVKVQSVSQSNDGLSYSIRCSTVGSYSAGVTVTGVVSWYLYSTGTLTAGMAIEAKAINSTIGVAGTGAVVLPFVHTGTNVDTSGVAVTRHSGPKFHAWTPGTTVVINSVTYTIASMVDDDNLILTSSAGVQSNVAFAAVNYDASKANNRPISITDDYMHISLFLQNPDNVVEINVMVDIDAGTTTVGAGGNAFTRNYWTWTITPEQLNDYGPGNYVGNSWSEVVVPISSGIRSGSDQTRTFATVKAIQIQLVTTGACAFGFDSWYFFGTYGPVIQPNAPVGYSYQSRNRDSTTGAASIPGPFTRYQMFPLRESCEVTPATTNQAGVDSLDIYRQGGTLTDFVYVGTVQNIPASPQSFQDSQSDASISTNPQPDLTLIQPWPILDTPKSGVVNVIGTSVFLVSGDPFNVNLLANTVIQINGVAYLTYGQPNSTTFLEINNSGGLQLGAQYKIASPTIAAQPLPFVFGPLEGPFSPVVFGLGDTKNAGTLYFCNPGNADAASDQNTVELAPPSEPLISGSTWNGLIFTGSNDNIYMSRYSYLENPNAIGTGVFQTVRIPSPSGMWSRYACTRGPDGVYFLGRDGIYKASENGCVSITDAQLYPLFPHDGQPATFERDFYPVNMTLTDELRLSANDFDIFFDYVDSQGNSVSLRYEISKQRWFPHFYANKIAYHYLVERSVDDPTDQTILLLGKETGVIYKSGGNTDNGADINTIVQTPSMDGGDPRIQKLFVDGMTDADGNGNLSLAYFLDNNQVASPVSVVTRTGSRQQTPTSISDLLTNLQLYRNISAKYSWTGGPAGPRLYVVNFTAYPQPYLSTKVTTQINIIQYPGWKIHRRLYAGLISTTVTRFIIHCQDGRTYGPYEIPSTGGRFKIFQQMLDHAIKDLAFGYELEGDNGSQFALFPDSFTVEMKGWSDPEFIDIAVFRT